MKRYGIVTALCLALIGITACGGAAGEAETGEKQTESEAEVKEVELWDSEKELEGELVIRSTGWNDQQQYMADQFMKENPGVTIRVVIPDQSLFDFSADDEAAAAVARQNEDNEMNTLVTELMSGETADIYNTMYMPMDKIDASAYFENLYDYMEQDPEFHMEDYYTNIFTALEYRGGLYGMPEGFTYHLVRINQSILEQTGIKVEETVTYKELKAIWDRAEQMGLTGDDFLLAEEGWIAEVLFDIEITLNLDMEAGESTLDTEEFVQCLKDIREMKVNYPEYAYMGYDEGSVEKNRLLDIFFSGRSSYSKYTREELGNATKSIVLTASDGSCPFLLLGSTYGISLGSEQKALAWEFIKYCIREKEYDFGYEEDNYYNYSETMSTPINRNNARKLYEYWVGDDEETIDWIIENDEKQNLKIIHNLILADPLVSLFDEYYAGDITAEECAQLMQERATIYLKE